MCHFIKLLNSPGFVPLAVNVACIGGRVIVGHTADDIANALHNLLEKVSIPPLDQHSRIKFLFFYKMVEDLPFADDGMPAKCNLKLTIPEDTQHLFRDNIKEFAEKCKKEIDSYITNCGIQKTRSAHIEKL